MMSQGWKFCRRFFTLKRAERTFLSSINFLLRGVTSPKIAIEDGTKLMTFIAGRLVSFCNIYRSVKKILPWLSAALTASYTTFHTPE